MLKNWRKNEMREQQRVEHKEMIESLREQTKALQTINENSKQSLYLDQKIKEDTTKIKVKVGLGGDD